MKLLKSITNVCLSGSLLFTSSLMAEDQAIEKKELTPEPIKEQVMNPSVKIETTLGDITLELNAEKAPITVKNFLSYVEDGYYDGTVFHRVIKNFMIQGGGMVIKGKGLDEKDTKAPIKNEAANGLKNDRGTVAMARTNDLHSATSQFFINTVDNASLNDGGPYGGYAVFAKVTEGMDVVDKIREVPTGQRGHHGDVPTQDIVIKAISKVAE